MLINSLKKLQSFGFNPQNILDIGANKGRWSLEVNKKVFPKSYFTLIEPIEYQDLEKISRKLKNFKVLNVLLDHIERKVTWYEKRNTGDSMFKENTGYFDDCVEIEKTTSIEPISIPNSSVGVAINPASFLLFNPSSISFLSSITGGFEIIWNVSLGSPKNSSKKSLLSSFIEALEPTTLNLPGSYAPILSRNRLII